MSEYTTLRALVGQFWPSDIIPLPTDGSPCFLDRIIVPEFEFAFGAGDDTMTLMVQIPGDTELAVEGTAGMQLVLGDGSGDIEATVTLTFGSALTLSISGLDFRLRFPEGWFRPTDDASYAEIGASGTITFDWSAGSTPSLSFSLDGDLSFGPFYLGESGVLVEATGVELDFDRNSNLDSLIEGVHYPTGGTFLGVYIASASVTLPDVLGDGEDMATFTMENAAIGTGGLTGSVSLLGVSWRLSLAGASFTLTDIELSFIQNSLTGSSIKGELAVPFLETNVQVEVSVEMGGSFAVIIDDTEGAGLIDVSLADVAEIEVDELGLEVADGLAEIVVGGTLTPLAQPSSGSFTWPEMRFSGLRIRSDGRVTVDGGGIALEEEATVDLFGFQLFISEIGFGVDETDRRWVRFSGGVAISGNLPMGASVDGLTVSWDHSGSSPSDIQVSLSGVGIELTVPDVFTFAGYVSLDMDAREFHGNLELALYPVDLAIQVEFIAGNTGSYRYWYLDIDVELPVGIPLGSTGLGIFGFRGLIAGNMAPDRADDEDWYEDWYKRDPIGISGDKFDPEEGALALGAGMTLGLLPTGYVLAAKGTFLISFPGPVLMLAGRASILQDRTKLATGDPPFSALMVADLDAGTFQLGVGIDFELAEVLDIAGDGQAYFEMADPEAWYLNLGQPPEEERIRATFLSLLQASGYFCISPTGIATGGGMELGGSWSFGPVDVVAELGFEGEGTLSFTPSQLAGSLASWASFGIEVSCVELGFYFTGTVVAQARDPSKLNISYVLEIGMPWPFEDVMIEIDLGWESGTDPVAEDPLQGVAFIHPLYGESWSIEDPNHMVSGASVSTSDLGPPSGAPAVPADSRPVFVFHRPMDDEAELSYNLVSITSSGTEKAGKARITRRLLSAKLYQWSSGSGGTATLVAEAPASSADALHAWWLAMLTGSSGYDALGLAESGAEVAATHLMLWGETPFDVSASLGALYQTLSVEYGYPCGSSVEEEWLCWTPPDEVVQGVSGVLTGEGIEIVLSGISMVVYRPPAEPGWSLHALTLGVGDSATLVPSQPAAKLIIDVELVTCDLRVEVDTGSGWSLETVLTPSFHGSFEVVRADLQQVRISAENGTGSAFLYGVCALTQESATAVERTKLLMTRLSEGVQAWSGQAEILEPNSHYYLELQTEVEIDGVGSNTVGYTHLVQFRTLGPPGSFGDVDSNWSGHELDSLERYVAKIHPSGSSVPHYRTYGLSVVFHRDHVDELYAGDLRFRLYDDNGHEVTDAAGGELVYYAGAPPEITASVTQYQWIETLSAADCTSSEEFSGSVSIGSTYTVSPPSLALDPQRRYTGQIEGNGVAVYTWSFVTSRYNTLTDHLADRLDTTFTIEVDAGTAPGDADFDALVSGSAVISTRLGYISPRGIGDTEGTAFEDALASLGVVDRPATERVDISLIESTARRYAILLESPEPLPFERLTLRLLRLTSAGTRRVTNWSVLRKADGTAALLFLAAGAYTAGDFTGDRFRLAVSLASDISDDDPSAAQWVLPDGADLESTSIDIDFS